MLDFLQGKGNTKQLLYKNFLFYKVDLKLFRCTNKNCNVTLTVSQDLNQVIREPSKHFNHFELSQCEIDVKKAVNQMRLDALNNIDSYPKNVYDQAIKNLTSKGYSLNEIYNANMPTFYATRSTLNSCRSNGCKKNDKLNK